MQLNDVQIERGDSGEVTLKIEVAPDAVKEARARVLKDLSKRVRVPGFRPGHVPANIVKRQVGEETIAQNVSDELVPQAYQAALAQTELRPLDRAQVDDVTFDAVDGEKPFTFTARFNARPEIEMPEYKGLEAGKPRVEVTDEDVERGLEELRNQRASTRNVDGRGAQDGDLINAELRVAMNGEPHGEAARLRPFALGQSGFVPEIDSHLVGVTLDEEREFSVKYPDDFHDAELAGKDAEFAVKITALKERVLPELTDEFAQTLQIENMDAVRERMREAIQDGRERESREALRSRLVNSLVSQTDFPLPQALLEERAKNRVENAERELSSRGVTLENYFEYSGTTREEFEAQARDEADTEFRQELVLEEIAHRENLTASPDDFENYYRTIASMMNVSLDDAVKNIEPDAARAAITQSKAVDLLETNAVVTEDEPLSEDDEDDFELVDVEDDAEIDDAIGDETLAQSEARWKAEAAAAATADENAAASGESEEPAVESGTEGEAAKS